MKDLHKFVKTNEDWHPNYLPKKYENCLDHNAVHVFAVILHTGEWRVGVWGADDYGLEKDGLTQAEAKDLFDSIGDFVTEKSLLERGFIQG